MNIGSSTILIIVPIPKIIIGILLSPSPDNIDRKKTANTINTTPIIKIFNAFLTEGTYLICAEKFMDKEYIDKININEFLLV